MECPRCRTALVMAERQGIEIDHCPNCRGVWLDRGELDKLIERSNAYFGGPGVQSGPYHGGGSDYRPPHQPAPPYGHQPGRKKSFWEEMFD